MNRISRWVPVVLYCALIFYITSLPMNGNLNISWEDKFWHLLMFIPLGYLFMCAINLKSNLSNLLLVVFSIVASTLLGVATEFHQAYIPSRSPEFLDGVMDAVGGGFGAMLFLLIHSYLCFMNRLLCKDH